eukprot:gene9569-12136_t
MWVGGEKHGHCVAKFANGDEFRGEWRSAGQSGFGHMHFILEGIIVSGQFSGGKLVEK